MFSLEGKTAFVTGGTAGIGRAVAARFVTANADVVIVGRRDGAEIAREIGATFIRADVAVEEQVAAALAEAAQRLGRLDIVVNNAGIDTGEHLITETETEVLERGWAVNFAGVWYGHKYAPRFMRDGGSIINTASYLASISAPGYGGYAAAKAGVVSLTKTAALELAPRRIRVNCVAPGTVLSEMTPLDHPEVELMKVLCPLQRVAVPEQDLAGLYHFLAANESAYITGQLIPVDGGLSAGFAIPLLNELSA